MPQNKWLACVILGCLSIAAPGLAAQLEVTFTYSAVGVVTLFNGGQEVCTVMGEDLEDLGQGLYRFSCPLPALRAGINKFTLSVGGSGLSSGYGLYPGIIGQVASEGSVSTGRINSGRVSFSPSP